MARVTYLFGAGASCECLPLVKDVPDRLEYFRKLVEGYNPSNLGDELLVPGQTRGSIKQEINGALAKLIEQVTHHASIDTYAKKLSLTRNFDYIPLKILLTFSFIYDQMVKPPDRRYDAFFASIMTNEILSFLDVRIISWNYDYQFEKSFSQFRNENSLIKLQEELNVIPFNGTIRDRDNFTIYKLNGTTSFRHHGNQFDNFHHALDDLSSSDVFNLIDKLFEYFAHFKDQSTSLRSGISFAWEGFGLARTIVAKAKIEMAKSKAVVVIGYSFPFFNREVDREIFGDLDKDVKIYVQDTNCELVINNLISVLPTNRIFTHKPIPINIKLSQDKRDINQFYLPAEL